MVSDRVSELWANAQRRRDRHRFPRAAPSFRNHHSLDPPLTNMQTDRQTDFIHACRRLIPRPPLLFGCDRMGHVVTKLKIRYLTVEFQIQRKPIDRSTYVHQQQSYSPPPPPQWSAGHTDAVLRAHQPSLFFGIILSDVIRFHKFKLSAN